MDKIKMTLEGLDGNAFNLLGTFREAAREQGWSAQQVSAVFAEATGGDYDHLVATLTEYIDEEVDC